MSVRGLPMEDRSFEELLALGVWVFAGFDPEDHEPMYALDPEVARLEAPELYWAEKNAVDEAIADAIEAGYLDWDVDLDSMSESLIVTKMGEQVAAEERGAA